MSEYESEEHEEDRDSGAISALLQQALADPPAPKKSLLPGIQERIRVRTKGRYYRDRFSKAKDPVPLLLMAVLLVLIICATTFLVIQPLVDAPTNTQLPDSPVDPLHDSLSPQPTGKNPQESPRP